MVYLFIPFLKDIWAIMNNVILNILLYVFYCTGAHILLSKYLGVEMLSEMIYGSSVLVGNVSSLNCNQLTLSSAV